MFTKKLRTLIALILVLCLTCIPALAASKDEVVYVNLSPSGQTRQVYVVNRFSDLTGETNITDYGRYTEIINLTSTDEISASGDIVSFQCGPEDFYYQGKLSGQDIPWSFRLDYQLNGNPVEASALSGADGDVEISIHTAPNPDADEVFLDHYMLQMTVNLDTTYCKNISAVNATEANLGTDRVLTYMLLAGEPQDVVITFTAENFRMGEISVNALPLSMDLGDFDPDELTGKIGDLTDAISQINSGTHRLKNGASDLSTGASTLGAASSEMSLAIGSLSDGSDALALNSTTVLTSINSMNDILNGEGSVSELLDVLETVEAFIRQLEGAVPGVSESTADLSALTSLADGLTGVGDYSADVAKVREALNAIYASKYADDLADYTDAAESICSALEQATADSQSVSAFKTQIAQQNIELESLQSFIDAIEKLKEDIAALKQALSDYLAGDIGIKELRSGVSQLAAGYAQLDAGIQTLSGGLGQLDTQYALMDSGIQTLDEGAADLASGAGAVSSGTGQLKSSTDGMDTEIDTAVDDALNAFGGDFDPVSFVDARNQVNLVQFVIRTDEIPAAEEPAEEEEIVVENKDENIFDRFLNLFRRED